MANGGRRAGIVGVFVDTGTRGGWVGWGGGGVEVELLVFNENRGGRHVVIDQRTGINKFNEVRK